MKAHGQSFVAVAGGAVPSTPEKQFLIPFLLVCMISMVSSCVNPDIVGTQAFDVRTTYPSGLAAMSSTHAVDVIYRCLAGSEAATGALDYDYCIGGSDQSLERVTNQGIIVSATFTTGSFSYTTGCGGASVNSYTTYQVPGVKNREPRLLPFDCFHGVIVHKWPYPRGPHRQQSIFDKNPPHGDYIAILYLDYRRSLNVLLTKEDLPAFLAATSVFIPGAKYNTATSLPSAEK